ncbi:MAG: hypothetical protein ABWZ40_14340 [Caulobacterales bacterium]
MPLLLRSRADGHDALAADARGAAAQKRTALLKLVAGLLGLSLGQLIDRDAQHRRKRRMQIAIGAGIVATVVGVLTTAWLGEARRSATEARSRLMGEVRQAFEVEDAPRAIAALAHLWPDLPKREQDAHRAVLSAWLARYPSLGESLLKVTDGQVFASGRRLFLKRGGSVEGLPFDDTNLVLPSPEGMIAMNGAGKILRAKHDLTAPSDITPTDATIWSKYRWESVVQLRNGLIAFSGMLQSASAGGATPTLLLYNPKTSAWKLIEQGYLDQPKFLISQDCMQIGFSGKAGPTPNMFVAGAGNPIALSAPALTDVTPLKTGATIEFNNSATTLDALAKVCGAGAVQSSDDAVRPQLSIPTLLQTPDGWTPSETLDWEPSQPTLEYLYSLGQFIQHGNFTMPNEHLARTKGDYETPEAQRAFIAGEFNGFDFAAGPTERLGAVGVFWAASGAQYGLRFICATPSAQESGAPVRCIDVRYHGDYGAVRLLGDWVYVQDMAYAGHPMFYLVRRSDMRVLRMDEPEVQGAPGGGAGAVALSPSGKKLIIAAGHQFWLFDVSAHKIKFVRKFDAAGLAGAASEDNGGETVTIAFIDEAHIVAARRDGLVFATDLNSREEMWRTRIRPTEGAGDSPAHLILAHGNRIAIAGADFATLLDTETGLALAPTVSVANYDRDVTPPEIAPEPVDHTCPVSSRREACMSSLELAKAVMEAEQGNRERLSVAQDGFILRSSDVTLVARNTQAAATAPAFASAPCRTGWRVHGGRIERFDPLANLQIGQTATIAKLTACKPAK